MSTEICISNEKADRFQPFKNEAFCTSLSIEIFNNHTSELKLLNIFIKLKTQTNFINSIYIRIISLKFIYHKINI